MTVVVLRCTAVYDVSQEVAIAVIDRERELNPFSTFNSVGLPQPKKMCEESGAHGESCSSRPFVVFDVMCLGRYRLYTARHMGFLVCRAYTTERGVSQ